MTQIETHSLRIERTLKAPIEKVRNALLDPALVAQWFAPGPMTAEVHSLDAKVGGQYEISMHGEEDGKPATHTCTGVFQELSDTRISMTFNWSTGEPMPNDTTLAYELEEVEGGTKLVLLHTGFPVQEAADMHTEGWLGCLDKLPALLA